MGIAMAKGDRVNVQDGPPVEEDPEARKRVLANVRRPPMVMDEMDLSRPPPGYPNPDAQSNPYGHSGQTLQMPEMDLSHGDNLGVSKMPPPPRWNADGGGAAGRNSQADEEKLSDPMQDPAFRAFVASKAQQLSELKAAQGQAAESRGSLGMRAGNALITLGMVGGRGMDPTGAIKQRYAEAGQPVEDVLERQRAAGELTKNAGADVALSGEMLKSRVAGEEADPNSPRSQAFARLYNLKPELRGQIPANMAPAVEKKGQLDVEHEKNAVELHKADMDQFAANEGQIYSKHTGDVKGGGTGGRPLHPQDAAKLDAILNGIESVDRLKSSRSEGVLPGVGEYNATVNAEAPAIAAADSGTGRASGQGDVIKRAPNLYNAAGDKTYDNDRQRYVQTAQERIKALKQAGYNVTAQEEHLSRLSGGSGAGGMVDVISPEGTQGQVPADKLDAALKKGFKRAGR